MLPAVTFIANIAPISQEWQSGVLSLAAIVALILSIGAHFRRKPPIDVDLVGLRADIQSLNGTVGELKAAKEDTSGHKHRIQELERRCELLDAQLKQEIAAQRSYTAKTTREIFDRIETVQGSVAANFKEVERGLGKVEGTLAEISRRLP